MNTLIGFTVGLLVGTILGVLAGSALGRHDDGSLSPWWLEVGV